MVLAAQQRERRHARVEFGRGRRKVEAVLTRAEGWTVEDEDLSRLLAIFHDTFDDRHALDGYLPDELALEANETAQALGGKVVYITPYEDPPPHMRDEAVW